MGWVQGQQPAVGSEAARNAEEVDQEKEYLDLFGIIKFVDKHYGSLE